MQWIALCLPHLSLESFLRASDTADPWAVAESRHVVDCNAAAFALGVRKGMARAAASAIAPLMRVCERDQEAENRALEEFAAWAGRFTPSVALANSRDGTRGLLLEVSGSLKLFGSTAAITGGLVRGALELGYSTNPASAPTPHAAWLLARAGSPAPCLSLVELFRRLQPLPVDVLDCDPRTRESLESLGIRTIGEVLGLPRPGLARRYGQSFCEELDRALGSRPDARAFFKPPERFDAILELPSEVMEAQALLFALRRLMVQLGGFLEAREGGVQRLRIALFHKEAVSEIEIGLVKPSRDVDHFILLAREKLASLTLKAPVRRIGLSAGDILCLLPQSLDLLDDALKKPGDWHGLVERLRARLGKSAVSGMATYPAHRPEASWRVAEPGEEGTRLEFGVRPFWLLPRPKRLDIDGDLPVCDGPLELVAGPERIESDWWDGHDASRDYYIARSSSDSLLWVYLEFASAKPDWYLHGVFG